MLSIFSHPHKTASPVLASSPVSPKSSFLSALGGKLKNLCRKKKAIRPKVCIVTWQFFGLRDRDLWHEVAQIKKNSHDRLVAIKNCFEKSGFLHPSMSYNEFMIAKEQALYQQAELLLLPSIIKPMAIELQDKLKPACKTFQRAQVEVEIEKLATLKIVSSRSSSISSPKDDLKNEERAEEIKMLSAQNLVSMRIAGMQGKQPERFSCGLQSEMATMKDLLRMDNLFEMIAVKNFLRIDNLKCAQLL